MRRDSIVAIDQGTTSSRAIRFDGKGTPQATAARELPQYYPQPGWVEQDAERIWADTLAVLQEVLDDNVAAIGITNQRETIVLWDRATGVPLHRAIVWQDRRTADICAALAAEGHEPMVQARTGLLINPYFSATKLAWLLDTIDGARERAEAGALAAGTIDSFLLWRLSGGRVHATDITNASRTMLCDIHRGAWDDDLLALFRVPRAILPRIVDNDAVLGETDPVLTGRAVPIAGMAGDQQAALIGQQCFEAGAVKSTYGTGCFLLANIGAAPLTSTASLLTTPAYRIRGRTAYAMEGAIFTAGSAMKWLRDTMGLFTRAEDTAAMAASVPDDHGVTFLPAFTGLGAPHWRSDVQASITGLRFDTGPAHIVRAALEAVAFQTADLIAAMRRDGMPAPSLMRIDGGMATNDWFAQFLADIVALPVERPADHEATALGAAWLAGHSSGTWRDPPVRQVTRFAPRMAEQRRDTLLDHWREQVERLLGP